MTLLRSVPAAFLGTARHEQIVLAHVDSSGPFLGTRKGTVTVTVRSHIGIDLLKVTEEDILIRGREVSIRLPDPEVLDVTPDLSSWRHFSSGSGFQRLRDFLVGPTLMEDLLKSLAAAIRQYRNADVSGERSGIVDRLNREANRLFEDTELRIFFH